ncbi:MAG: NAD(P)/FAD-dependent oxidoreductase [Candidatus Aenigmarchaeota archaeon]|nr:NAD(P)/FAD-dependent oxidoreductase [Candidatus Aenigmarchaeota archaeon]
MIYDLIIIGAGPAGLSASLTASYLKLKHIVIEANLGGGALIQGYPWKKVDSFLGFWNKTGQEMSDIMMDHVQREGSEIREKEPVEKIEKNEKSKTFMIHTTKKEYETKSILIATGIAGTPRKLGINGEDHKRVHYSIKNPALYEGHKVLVVGGGDTAVEAAFALSNAKADVSIVHRKDVFRCTEKNTACINKTDAIILFNTELTEIKAGAENIESVTLLDNIKSKTKNDKFDDIFIFAGSVISIDYLKDLDIKMEGNKVVVDNQMKTSIDGIYAAGDITGKLMRIPEAIGEGHLAVYSIFKYLRNPYWA